MRNDHDLRDSRRELRGAIAKTQGEEKVLAVIPMRSGGAEVRLAWYRERVRPPVLSLWLYHQAGEGALVPDRRRGFRFFANELAPLARGLALALEEAERWARER